MALARFSMNLQLIIGQSVTYNRIFLRKCARWSDLSQGLSQALAPLQDRLDRMLELLETLCHTLAQPSTAASPRRPGAATPPDPVLTQIRRWQAEGLSLRAIAARLNADGVPTRSGQGQWYQSNLSRLLKRASLR
jgi:hypothetical protein